MSYRCSRVAFLLISYQFQVEFGVSDGHPRLHVPKRGPHSSWRQNSLGFCEEALCSRRSFSFMTYCRVFHQLGWTNVHTFQLKPVERIHFLTEAPVLSLHCGKYKALRIQVDCGRCSCTYKRRYCLHYAFAPLQFGSLICRQRSRVWKS